MTILQDDVSYGVARDKKELKSMSDRARAAVGTGVLADTARVEVKDPEAAKLIEQARVKVIPFLDASEVGPIDAAASMIESATSEGERSSAKIELKRLLSPYSFLT